MRRFINNIISVLISFFRFLFYKLCFGKSVKFYYIQRISPNVLLDFNKNCSVTFGKKVRIHSGTKVKVIKNGRLEIQDNVKINYNCIIACMDEICIGSGTEIGPAVFVYDHDHDYKKGLFTNSDAEEFKTSPVIIGRNCWIGAQTVILKGTKIGDNCVIGAGSLVCGNIPANSVIYQKREYSIKPIL